MHRLFVGIADELARQPQVRDAGLPKAFSDAKGIELERYLAIAAAIVSRFAVWNGAPSEWALTREYLENTSITDDEFQRVAGNWAATPTDFVKAFRSEIAKGHDGLWDLDPIARHPLCEIEPGRFLALDPPLVHERLLGDGIYWLLRALFKNKDVFGAAVGRLLERHIFEIAESTLEGDASSEIFPESDYHRKLGTDFAVWTDGDLILGEVGAGRAHFDSILRGDLDAFSKDIKNLVLPRAVQLDGKIGDIREGTLTFPGVPKNARISPVICLFDGFPQGRFLTRRIVAALRDAKLLGGRGVEDVVLLGPAEWEAVCSLHESGRSRISATLALYRHAHPRLPMADVIAGGFGEVSPPRLVSEHDDCLMARWTEELGFTA